jgi:nitroimidazol reductase NimA-like FMN-containing flavoprotein (pyridoxamine 5'-phosphate oxidase superfamily)
MVVSMRAGQPDIEILTRAECLRLLGTVPFGRLVHTDAASVAVQPVNFVVRGDAVIVRTASAAKLAAATGSGLLAVEADDINIQTRAGWSVTVVGHSHEVVDPVELSELALTGPDAWGRPGSDRFIAVRIEQVSGRWLHSPVGAPH